MAKLTFPTLINTAYRSAISLLRTDLLVIAETARKSPGIIDDIGAHLAVLVNQLGLSIPNAGTPGQPTGLTAYQGASGAVALAFVTGANTQSWEWARSVDGGTTFTAYTALPANRVVTGLSLVSSIFRVRGVSTTATGVVSANSNTIVIV